MHLESFYYDMERILQAETLRDYPLKREKQAYFLFSYEERDPLNGQAKVERIREEMG